MVIGSMFMTLATCMTDANSARRRAGGRRKIFRRGPRASKFLRPSALSVAMKRYIGSMRCLCVLLLCACACQISSRSDAPAGPVPIVAVVDDGERISRQAGPLPVLLGKGNPVWRPGQPVALFGLPGETLAIQVVVTAREPLSGVTVELPGLSGPAPIPEGAIARFVVHELTMRRRSGGKDPRESLGWAPGAMPPDCQPPCNVPDPLIPVAHAPPWADYPMTVAPAEHRVVWIDLFLDERLPAGEYRGTIAVRAGTGDLARIDLARIDLKIEVGKTPLPYRPVRTMVFYDPEEIRGRVGPGQAVRRYLQLMHRYHLTTIYRVNRPEDVAAQREELVGTLFTREQGYTGPGTGMGADVVALGSYGSLGPPTPERVHQVERTLAALREAGVLRRRPDVFLYAVDEQCESLRGPAWRAALRQSTLPEARQLRVAHTCSTDPARQEVDLPIIFSASYDPDLAAAARQQGKAVWVYNGSLPRTGSFLSDGGPLSLRINGWLQALYGIERWFYWESTFWNDDNKGGRGPYDPLVTAETFHNQHGDWANGDGVLVYPGRQARDGYRSLGLDGVVPSIRLAQWRRGISDAGYLLLARQRGGDAAKEAERIGRALIGRGFAAARGRTPAWPQQGAPYFAARRKLFDLLK
jgi:hypothetical protein